MAPATRRSSGFGSHANSPSNLDHILEHFNQFKRKHITQNRDIIKTNALAQLRIKELEEKVLGLEAEKTQIELERHRMKARLERAEKAVICIRQGWQLIGAGMTAVASIDGFENVTTEQKQTITPSSALIALQQHKQQAHLRPSVRVVLDPNALPGGVARNVARPPEADLADLAEEETIELEEQHNNDYISDARFEHQGQITLEEPEIVDDVDSDNGEMGDPVSFAGDGEDTVRLQSDLNNTVPHIHDEVFGQEDDTLLIQSHPDAEQQSNYHLDLPSSTITGQRNRVIQRMTSMDSLSSFADDEEIELSTDDEGGQNSIPKRAPTPVNNGSVRSQNGVGKTKTPRKRKTPSSPEDARGPLSSISASSSTTDLHQHDTVSASQSEAEMDEEDEENSSNSSNGTRASRRSSMRDRKSVNYALPKLNTKMRKPDPAELIPAVGSQRKKRQGSMQAGLNGEEVSEINGENSDEEDEPKRRMLKGKNEAASTGNLREIRKLHQEKAQNDESLSPNREQEKQEDDVEVEAVKHKSSDNQDEEKQSESPRRRSSRQSLRRRSSSSMTSENGMTGNVTNTTKADQTKSEETRSQRGGSSSPEDRKVVQRKDNQAEYTLPGMQKPRQSASKIANSTNGTSTPKWRSMSGGMSNSSSQSSSIGLGPSGSGTPIPKPTIRAGQQGTIKALNKAAGRIQKTSSSVSGLSNNGVSNGNGNSIQQQQKRVTAAFSNGSRTDTQNGKSESQARILGASAKANTTARSISGSSTTSSSSSSQSTTGDPTKRNSLHAAMTWHDIPSASQHN